MSPGNTILVLIFVLLIASASSARSATGEREQPQARTASPESPVYIETIALERSKLEFQKELEGKKLELEQRKAWLTAGSILAPFFLGWITLALQLWNTHKLRERQAKEDFELKVVEIVMTAESPRVARNKALAMAALFPTRLPSNFAEEFLPERYSGPHHARKIEMFNAASAKAQTPQEVFAMWHLLFPDDDWIKPLFSTVSQSKDQAQGQT